jgi:hypothetical protein
MAGYVARMRNIMKEFKVLAWKPEGNKSLEGPIFRSEDDIEMVFK